MKTPSLFKFISIVVYSPTLGIAGDFINLSFDSPDLGNLQTDPEFGFQYGTPSDLLPGWSITQDGAPIDQVWFKNISLNAPVTLVVTAPGSYLVWYNGIYHPNPGVEIQKATSFSQIGTIPREAIGMRFVWGGREFLGDNPLHINGQTVAISNDPQRPQFYEADVSRWAGQEVLLSFDFRTGSASDLDDISFVIVPEPSTWALLGLGALTLGWAWRRRAG